MLKKLIIMNQSFNGLSGGEKAYATEDISSSHGDAENEIDK